MIANRRKPGEAPDKGAGREKESKKNILAGCGWLLALVYKVMKWIGVVIAPIAIIISTYQYYESRPHLELEFDKSAIHFRPLNVTQQNASDCLVTSFLVTNKGNWGMSIVSVELTATVNGEWIEAVDESRRNFGDKAFRIPILLAGGESRRISILWVMSGWGAGTRFGMKWANLFKEAWPLTLEVRDSRGIRHTWIYDFSLKGKAVLGEDTLNNLEVKWALGCPPYPKQASDLRTTGRTR